MSQGQIGDLGLVFPVKQFADTGFIEDRREGVGDDFGHREHLELVEILPILQRQGVGQDHS